MQTVPTTFWEWLANLDDGQFMGLMFMVVLVLLVITITLCVTIYGVHKNRLDTALKREMLDRGLSPDEIATVVNSRPAKSRGCGRLGSSA
jgi:hypothetical protein